MYCACDNAFSLISKEAPEILVEDIQDPLSISAPHGEALARFSAMAILGQELLRDSFPIVQKEDNLPPLSLSLALFFFTFFKK